MLQKSASDLVLGESPFSAPECLETDSRANPSRGHSSPQKSCIFADLARPECHASSGIQALLKGVDTELTAQWHQLPDSSVTANSLPVGVLGE
ncbi:hypothetical protein NM688_g8281 [Phlebia brevispora]|uniref:Uncharacterized protein n=1 Tax=Phlebia brevispora TaxID=194682 RepID=A0ACC1RUX7_9APHY|nr:hypothetical protein NM688_g8281 [Phlebia brevispora]